MRDSHLKVSKGILKLWSGNQVIWVIAGGCYHCLEEGHPQNRGFSMKVRGRLPLLGARKPRKSQLS